ncbi:MAG: trigger factor, partial [Betaproteobacteria bacterium]|nr:trigger factor [Betaproteobacteria bacterium]
MQAQASTSTPSALERNIVLTLKSAEIDTQIQSRLKQIARTAKMSGFRPGKVPFSVVANQYGYQVRQEVMSDSVQRSFADAVKEQNLRVAGYPRFAPAGQAPAPDQFAFTATFEVYPDFALGSLSGQKLERPKSAVTEKDVDNTIETLRKQRATFDKADRAAQKGDFLVIDFDGTVDGTPFEGGKAENFGVVLGDGRMLPDFEAALNGMAGSETKVFPLTFPADYSADVAGKTAEFKVTVKIVNSPIYPAVDGEFAKSLGVSDGDVSKMRAEIK